MKNKSDGSGISAEKNYFFCHVFRRHAHTDKDIHGHRRKHKHKHRQKDTDTHTALEAHTPKGYIMNTLEETRVWREKSAQM